MKKISKQLPQRKLLWGLYIKLKENKKTSFEAFAKLNKSHTNTELYFLLRGY